MSQQVRFGIVGCGVIGPAHAQAIAHSDQAQLVAVCDIVKERADQVAKEYAVDQVFTDYEEMMRRAELDVVSVCVPSGLHGEVTMAAAQAGHHVLCEKPLEITSAKMTRMIAACREAGVKLGGVFQRRTMQAAVITQEAIRQGKLGKLVLGDAYLKYYRSPEYYKSAGWRGTWEMDGGGCLMNQGIHGIDLLQWMVGEVETVFARGAALVRDIEVEDTAVAVLRYRNGAFGVIQGATSVYPGLDTRFEIHGEKGSIIFSDSGFQLWEFQGVNEPMPDAQDDVGGAQDPKQISSLGHYLIVDDMAQAVLDDREPLVCGEEARKGVDLLLAIYASIRTGQEVQVEVV